ncbi:beta strand repeat-containing protein [Paraburkholderia caribensis]|uniref:beta strand repeat-containing protein n=1 Tax=Paraburkholderia caribensis TaxID=75105 RepID=UPI001D06F675|nr:hypothetical protein [Paraburkholderia caribensis]
MIDSGQATGAQSSSALVLTSGKATFYLNNSKQTTSNVMTATASNGNVLLTGLDRGAVTSGSLDAINGSQLYATNQNVSNLSNVVNNIGGANGVKYFHANSTQTDSLASGTESIAVGVAAVSSGAASIAQGAVANASGNYSVALGAGASATGSNSVALGSNSVARSSTLGSAGFNAGSAALSAATASGELSIGGVGTERRITNVAAGYSATDAVNVSQLMSENAKVNQMGANTAAAMGGNSSFNSTTGAITNPTYVVAKGTYNSVGAALTALDNSKGGDNPLAVAYDDTSKNQITLQGANGATKIANLTAGTSPNDAVNVSQLSGVTAALGGGAAVNADGSVKPPSYTVYGNTFSNVGDALSNISSSTANLVQNVKYIKFGDFGTASAAQAAGSDTIALGGNANASQNGAIAIGRSAVASALNSVAIGYGSLANQANTFSVGNVISQRRITNVADGISDTDAATVGQVTSDIQAAIANLNSANNSGLLKSSVRSTSLLGAAPTSSLPPDQLIASGPLTTGTAITASGHDSIAIGLNTFATADNSAAIGNNVQALSPGAVAIGQQAHTDGVNTVAIGTEVSSLADNAVVIGNNNSAVVAGATNGIAIGNNVTIGGVNSMGIGANIVASGSNSVTLGYGSADGGRANVLSVGNTKAGGQRQIVNVAAGTQKTDAVNVSQLTGVTAALGGGATVNTDGSIKAPTYNVQGTTATDVGTAIAKLDGTVSNVSNNVTNLTQNFNNVVNGGGIKYFHASSTLADSSASGTESVAIGGGAIASGANSIALGSGSVASSGSLGVKGFAPDNAALMAGTAFGELSVGTSGKERRITNVAAGYNATDAVNVSQLMAEDVRVNNVSNNLSNLSNVVNNIGANVSMKYFHANSSLVDSTASGANAIAVGPQATAAGTNAIAVGYNASATSAESVALGSNATTSANLSATAYNPGNAALSGTTAAGEVSVGNASFNRRITNVAAGYAGTDAVNVSQLMAENAKVNAEGTATAAALGSGSTYDPTTGNISAPTYVTGGSTYSNVGGAITNIDARLANITSGTGEGIKYFHANSTLGDSSASGKDSVAIGGAATASTANSVALGSSSLANSTTLGQAGFAPGGATLSGTTAFGEVSVGAQGKERRITNVAAGYAGTDAVNVSQLMAEDAKVNNVSNNVTYLNNLVQNYGNNIINGDGIKYFHANSTLGDSSASGKDSVAIGGAATASTANSVALGSSSLANSTTLGQAGFAPGGATLSGTTAFGEVSVGAQGKERRITNVAAGYAGTDAVNVSQLMAEDAKVNNVSSNVSNLSNVVNNIAGGANIKYFNVSSSLAAASANGTDSVAAGPGAVVLSTASGAVALGANSVADRANTVSVGSAGAQRQIVNVAAGVQPTDAVNVTQLSGITQALGGGASVKADGSIAQPTYNVYGNTYSNVGDALGNISSATGNLVENLKYIRFGNFGSAAAAQASLNDTIAFGGNANASQNGAIAIGRSAAASAVNSVALGYGSIANQAYTFSVGNAITQRRITNVADGINDTDAATVGQVASDIQAAIANLNSAAHSSLLQSAVQPGLKLGIPPLRAWLLIS